MSTRVYVGGISYRARERDIEKFFRKYGRIREISMKNGYCFVEFEDYRDADDACYELNGKDFLGDRVTVEIARGTPHGRDKDRWGTGGGRRGSPSRGSRDRPVWLDKYGPPTRTDYKVIVENLSSRVSWQVRMSKTIFFLAQEQPRGRGDFIYPSEVELYRTFFSVPILAQLFFLFFTTYCEFCLLHSV